MTRHRLAAQQRPYDDCNYGHDDELERIDPPGNDGNTADGQQQVARSEGNRTPVSSMKRKPQMTAARVSPSRPWIQAAGFIC